MTRRAWIFVASGYALLALGTLIALIVLGRQANRIENQTDELETQARQIRSSVGLFCEISQLGDAGETRLLKFIADGGIIGSLSPTCQKLVVRIYKIETSDE